MSVEHLAIALHHSRAAGTDKLVLIGIANHAGDGGAWPAVETLARYANVSERSVQRSLARLSVCPEDCPAAAEPTCRAHLREIRRHVQAGGLADWDDYTRPNRYDVLVVCPEWCDHTPHHRPREGWTYDRELGDVVRVEQQPAPDQVPVDQVPEQPAPADQVPEQPGPPAVEQGYPQDDTPESENSATRRVDRVTPVSPGDASVTGGVTPASPKPSLNPSQLSPSSCLPDPRRRAEPAQAVVHPQLDSVRSKLRDASAEHRRRERGAP